MTPPTAVNRRDLAPLLLTWGAILIPFFALVAPKISYWPLVIAGAVGLIRVAVLRLTPPRSLLPLFGWLAALLLWIAVSLAYAPDAQAGTVLLLKLFGYGACGLLLIWVALEDGARMRSGVGFVHIAGSLAVIGALALDLATGGAVSTLIYGDAPATGTTNRHATAIVYLALFAWPLCIRLGDISGVWARVLPPIIVIVLAWLFGQFAVALGVLAGALVFGLAMLRPRAVAIAMAVLCAGFVLLAPVAGKLLTPGPWLRSAPAAIQFSAYHRAKIWSFTAERIAERPLFGWGIDASRRIPGGDAIVDINRDLGFPDRRYVTGAKAMPLHPHNAALQVWLELGGIGALLLAALCGGLPLVCMRAPWRRASIAAGLATYAAAYVPAMLSFSLWQSRWHAMLWLAGASAVVLLRSDTQSGKETPTPTGR